VRRTPRPPTSDELAVERTAGEAVRLRDAASALATAEPRLAALVRRIAAEHEEHLRALGVLDRASLPTTGPTPVPPGAAGQRAAEWDGAQAALRDALDAGPGLAALLARIAAARVLHADAVAGAAPGGPAPPARLDPAASPARSTSTGGPVGAAAPTASTAGGADLPEPAREALGRLLAGEHAAVFAYPLVVARCAAARRDRARQLWRAHVAERDALERLLISGGADPPAPAAAYDVGPPPDDAAAAAKLAATVESGLAALAVPAVAATTGGARLVSARALVTASRRATAWGGSPGALPGSPPA
jgi:hypothetical protein